MCNIVRVQQSKAGKKETLKEIKKNLLKSLEEESIKYKSAEAYSTPTRLVLLVRDLPSEIKIEAKEVRGPKVGVPENIIEGFMKSHQITKKDLFEKMEEKGNFYFFNKAAKKILTEDILTKLIPKAIASINWKKSMRWSDHDLMWGRPLRSILAIFNNKHLKFEYHHLESTDGIIIVDNFIDKIKKMDAIIISVPHEKYLIFQESDWDRFFKKNGVLMDVKSIYDKSIFERKLFSYWSL